MSTLRDLSRFARRVPIVKKAVEAGDPRRRAERLSRTGIIDTDLYARQLGVPSISVDDAAAHYSSVGFRLGFTLNVLTDPFVIRRGMIRTNRPALYDYFNSQAWHVRTTGVWSAAHYAEEHPGALDHPTGPVGHLWDRVTRDPQTTIVIEPGGTRTVTWAEIYPVLADATVEWSTLERDRRARYPRPALEHSEALPSDAGDAHAQKVSIVMPVWNRGGGMRKAVDSIRAQSWSNWELLIVDDGSWDDTIAVAELLARRDDRIRLIQQEHLGVCAARNAGIDEAHGEFIAFLDSDNTWRPNFLGDMVSTMVKDDLTAAYATIALSDGEHLSYRYGAPAKESLLRGNSIDLNTLVARRHAVQEVGGFDPALRRAVDYDLILKLAERAPIVHVPTLGAVYDNSEDASDRISTTEAFGWNTAVRLRHSSEQERPASGAPVKVVSILQRHDPALATKLAALIDLEDDTDVTIAAVGVKPDEWRQVSACVFDRPRMNAVQHPRGEAIAYVVNLELRESCGDVFAVIDPRSLFTSEGLRELIDEVIAGDADCAIPLTVAIDGTIESIGSFLGGPQRVPVSILAGHPSEDATALGKRVVIPALSGRTFAIRREVFAAAGGLDPLIHNAHELAALSDSLIGRRLIARTDVRFVQVARPIEFGEVDDNGTMSALRKRLSTAPVKDPDDIYNLLGMRIAHLRAQPLAASNDARSTSAGSRREHLVPVVVREAEWTHLDGQKVPRLRWAIKTAAPAGPSGEGWGDTHFARSLAAALNSLGQFAVVDSRNARRRSTEYLDDVVVHLRGLDEHVPFSGSLNYLWVISHPDMITRAETARFDRAFAASVPWSARATQRWGLEVEPLLQCTDPAKFRPLPVTERQGILFVGNSRGVPRATVMESVKAGIDLELYGGDWERFIPAEAITGRGIDNDELGSRYASASVVLNDHWSDMQREGFISNRLFDVAAAGGRAYSDDVSGIDEIFGGAVQTYRAVSEIAPFLTGDMDSHFPDEDALQRISARIRAEHSFDARARVLIARAVEDKSRERDLRSQ